MAFNLKPKLDYPTSFEGLRAFKESFEDAVARDDQALFDYLAENFAVCPDGVLFIGGEYFSHSDDSNSSAQVGRTQKQTEK